MKKRIGASLVSSVMLLSSFTAFAQSGFSDLTEFHAWAEPQIEQMTTLGIIKGYNDGTFRPDQSITKTEALVLAARVAGYVTKDYDEFKAAASTRYASVVEEYKTPYPNEVSYLLYKGLLSESDLPGFIGTGRADSPLLRYEMAALITKLMRAEGELNTTGKFSYTYSDAGEIPFDAAASVEYVTNNSLMQGVFDPEKKDEIFFKPYDSVTRAQMAVLLHRMIGKMNIDVSYYSVLGKNSQNNTLTYRDETGKTNLFPIKDEINLIVDGYKTENVDNIHTGAKMAFFRINNTVVDVEVVNDEENRWDGIDSVVTTPVPTAPVEGIITTIVLSEECSVTVNDVEYTLSAASTIYVNHIASTVYDLRVGHTAKLEFVDGKVITLNSSSSDDKVSETVTAEGVITQINLTNREVNIEVENANTGDYSEKLLIIETGAAIYNGISGKAIDFASLEIDDRIIVTGTIEDDGNFYASKIIVR